MNNHEIKYLKIGIEKVLDLQFNEANMDGNQFYPESFYNSVDMTTYLEVENTEGDDVMIKFSSKKFTERLKKDPSVIKELLEILNK